MADRQARGLGRNDVVNAMLTADKLFPTGSAAYLWAVNNRRKLRNWSLRDIEKKFTKRFGATGKPGDHMHRFISTPLKLLGGREINLREAIHFREMVAKTAKVKLEAEAVKKEIVELLPNHARTRLTSRKCKSIDHLLQEVDQVCVEYRLNEDPLQRYEYTDNELISRALRMHGCKFKPLRKANQQVHANSQPAQNQTSSTQQNQSSQRNGRRRHRHRETVVVAAINSAATAPSTNNTNSTNTTGSTTHTEEKTHSPCYYCTKILDPPLPPEKAMHRHRDCPHWNDFPQRLKDASLGKTNGRGRGGRGRGSRGGRGGGRGGRSGNSTSGETTQAVVQPSTTPPPGEGRQNSPTPAADSSALHTNVVDVVDRDASDYWYQEFDERPDEDIVDALSRPKLTLERDEIFMIAPDSEVTARMVHAEMAMEDRKMPAGLSLHQSILGQVDEVYGPVHLPIPPINRLHDNTRSCLLISDVETLNKAWTYLETSNSAELVGVLPKAVYDTEVFENFLIDIPWVIRPDRREPLAMTKNNEQYRAREPWVLALFSSDKNRSALFRAAAGAEGPAKRVAVGEYLDLLAGRSHAVYTRYLAENKVASQAVAADEEKRTATSDPELPRHPTTPQELRAINLAECVERYGRQSFTPLTNSLEVSQPTNKGATVIEPTLPEQQPEEKKSYTPLHRLTDRRPQIINMASVWLNEPSSRPSVVDLGKIELKQKVRPARAAVVFTLQKDRELHNTILPCLMDTGAAATLIPRQLQGVAFDTLHETCPRILRGFNGSEETMTKKTTVKMSFLSIHGVPLMFETEAYVADVNEVIIGNDLCSTLSISMHIRDNGTSVAKLDSQPYLPIPLSVEPDLRELRKILHLVPHSTDHGIVLEPASSLFEPQNERKVTTTDSVNVTADREEEGDVTANVTSKQAEVSLNGNRV